MKTSSSAGKIIINAIIYSFSGLLLKCFSFFLLPLYTSYLSTKDYGISSIASSFLTTSGFIVSFSLFSAIMRFYVDLKEDEKKIKRFYGTVVVFIFLTSAIAVSVLCAFKTLVSRYIFSGINFFPIIFVCAISILFYCLHQVYENILRSQQKAAKVSIINIIYFLLGVLFNIIFVVGFKMGALGVVLSSAISSALYAAYFLFDMIRTRSITFCLDFPMLKEALKYSIPIMPHNLSTQLAILISQALIGGTSTLESLGVYSIASQFGNIADTVQSYINQAYGPWLYERLHEKENFYKNSIRSIVNMLVMVIGLFMLGIALFAEDYISLFLNQSYVGASLFVPLILFVYIIKIPYYFYVNILFYYKKASRLLFVSTLTSSILNVVISAFLIPLFGVYGSVFADAISMVVRVLIVILVSKKFESIGLRVRDFILNSLLIVGFIAAGLIFSVLKHQGVFSVLNFLYKIMIVLLYIVLLLFLYRKPLSAFIANIRTKKGGGKKGETTN